MQAPRIPEDGEPITNTAVAVVMWTAAWQQLLELADPITRLYLPNLREFFHMVGTEAVQLMGATAVGTMSTSSRGQWSTRQPQTSSSPHHRGAQSQRISSCQMEM